MDPNPTEEQIEETVEEFQHATEEYAQAMRSFREVRQQLLEKWTNVIDIERAKQIVKNIHDTI